MVKGISRRVIVVRTPEVGLFEQAVFFLREDALQRSGVTSEQVVQQARQVAAGYLRQVEDPRRSWHPSGAWWCALGVSVSSFVWAMICLLT
jgi:hypothetical protein